MRSGHELYHAKIFDGIGFFVPAMVMAADNGLAVSHALANDDVLRVENADTQSAAVHGTASLVGVQGLGSVAAGSKGVHGLAADKGVYGEGKYYGVLGTATNGLSEAVHSEGDARVTGDMTVYGAISGDVQAQGFQFYSLQSGLLRIPANAFNPSSELESFNFDYAGNDGNYDLAPTTVSQVSTFVATLQLPHGATVDSLGYTFFRKGQPNGVTTLALYRVAHDGTEQSMVAVSSADASLGSDFVSSNSIAHDQVDNQNYGYYLFLSLPPATSLTEYYAAVTVTIRYSLSKPY